MFVVTVVLVGGLLEYMCLLLLAHSHWSSVSICLLLSCLYVCLSVCLYVCLFVFLAICQICFHKVSLQLTQMQTT